MALVLPASFGAAQAVPASLSVAPVADQHHGDGSTERPTAEAHRPGSPSLANHLSTQPTLVLAPKGRPAAVIDETNRQRVQDVSSETSYDIPQAALEAYRHAARVEPEVNASCHLSWGVLAGIGQVESDQGRYAGSVVLASGTTYPTILGLQLNGLGNVAAIPDTDNGTLDGDTVWDRAVGPMQFIPSTWAVIGADGDGDGVKNPNDFNDAALATANYLCGGGADMQVPGQAVEAVYRYNHSYDYVNLVLSIAHTYDSGVVDVVPNDPTPTPAERRADAAAYAAAAARVARQERAARSATQYVEPDIQGQRTEHNRGRTPTWHPGRPGGSGHEPAHHGPNPTPPNKPTPPSKPTNPAPPRVPTPTPVTPKPTPPTKPTPTPSPTPPSTPPVEPTPPTKPTPTPTPPTKPTPKPPTKPTPTPPPVITVLTGTFSQCDAQWCLADAALNFGTDADLSVVQGDYDGDGAAETVSDELAGLAELKSDVTVGVDADGLVVSINDLPYTFGDPPTDPGAPVVAPVIPPVTPPTATPGASSSD